MFKGCNSDVPTVFYLKAMESVIVKQIHVIACYPHLPKWSRWLHFRYINNAIEMLTPLSETEYIRIE